MQKTGKVKLPPGKKVAVNLGCDFDAQSIWDGSYNLLSPAYMSRGEFGAEVGAPRLLELFKKYNIKTVGLYRVIRLIPSRISVRKSWPQDMKWDVTDMYMRIPLSRLTSRRTKCYRWRWSP